MDVLRRLIILQPILVLSVVIGFWALVRKAKPGSFTLGGLDSQALRCGLARP